MSRVHAALAKKDWSVLHVSERASAYAAANMPMQMSRLKLSTGPVQHVYHEIVQRFHSDVILQDEVEDD